MVTLVDDEHTHRFKIREYVLLHGERLEHGDDVITPLDLFFVLLDDADFHTGTKLFDAFAPLLREKLLVNYDHGSELEMRRDGERQHGLSESTR